MALADDPEHARIPAPGVSVQVVSILLLGCVILPSLKPPMVLPLAVA